MMLVSVVAVAEKSQHSRYVLESFARQRYDRDRLQVNGLGTIFGRYYHARLSYDVLDKVAYYAAEMNNLVNVRYERELKVARWLAYQPLFAYGAALSVGMMDWRWVGFHKKLTVDRVISGPPNNDGINFRLPVGTYLRCYWDGAWRVTNYLNDDIGFLNLAGVDDEVDYDGVIVCIYSQLSAGTPDGQIRGYNGQYDVVIMGKSDWYRYDEWEELYWPFTKMVREELAADNSGGGSDDESLFSDNS